MRTLVAVIVLGLLATVPTVSLGAAPQALRVAVQEDVRTMDNVLLQKEWDRFIVGNSVYDSLVTIGADGSIAPELATSWSVTPDGKTWTFNIRSDVRFQNGRLMTAWDVKRNWDTIRDPKVGSPWFSVLKDVEDISVPNVNQVVARFRSPNFLFPSQLANDIYYAPTEERARFGAAYGRHPVGTGPYRLTSWTPQDRIVFDRNPSYWGPVPAYDRVEFVVIPDPNVAGVNLIGGNVDLVPNYVPAQMLPRLENGPLKVAARPGTTWSFISFDGFKEYKDVNVANFRLGIASLINAQDMNKILGKSGTYGPTPIPPTQQGFYKPDLPPYSPEKAKQYLSQSGWSSSVPINILVSDKPEMSDLAVLLQRQIHDIGYQADIHVMPNDAAVQESTKYQWDLLFISASGRPDAGAWFRDRFYSTLATPRNFFWTYISPDYDKLVDQALNTPDPNRRVVLYRAIQEQLISKDRMVLGLFWANAIWAYDSRRITNLQIPADEWGGQFIDVVRKP